MSNDTTTVHFLRTCDGSPVLLLRMPEQVEVLIPRDAVSSIMVLLPKGGGEGLSNLFVHMRDGHCCGLPGEIMITRQDAVSIRRWLCGEGVVSESARGELRP